ncbi:MAG: hypothetical protein OXI63_13025 [Candidatus Poribacteria bacterium]|nr:hypothetical protein [Candidatus Poribacteria bacterium]
MKKYLQTTLFGLSILLVLSYFVVNADTAKTTTSGVKYQWYPKDRKYHDFFSTDAPEGHFYSTLLKATANIDDTPEKETVVLMLVDVGVKNYAYAGNWSQAFLLIAENAAAGPKKKAFFKLFDSGALALDVPAKAIELRSPPFVFIEPPKDALKSRNIVCKLVDLTGDGILDIWVKFGYAVAVISFQDGEFKEILSSYTVPGLLPDAEYVDLDSDGSYEIKVPYSIPINDVPGAPYLPWMSLYEWNGTAYILNNRRFYAEDGDFLVRLLSEYNYQILRHGSIITLCETYNFYIGLVCYYYGNVGMARGYLQSVIERGKTDDFIQTAESFLKKLPHRRR